MNFTKMNGAGNDFVLLDNRDGEIHLDATKIERLCDRHRGVGADGVLVVESPQNEADFRMRYYNRDGGEAEMCGNGARCFARFASRLTNANREITFETMAGNISAKLVNDLVRLKMSEPKDLVMNSSLVANGQTFTVHSVNTGVPHAVVVVEKLEEVEVDKLGASLRYHQHFAPKGTNVNFIKLVHGQSVAIRTYERGVEAETLACGTGVVASALVFHELTNANTPISVQVKGGDSLEVGFEKTSGIYTNVTLTGPAEFVFQGQIDV